MKSRERDFSMREDELQDKLDKVSLTNYSFVVSLQAIDTSF